MRIHFVAIGGSIMHNLAIALSNKGFQISGSDDEIFEPAKSNLKKYNLLPEEIGWHPSKIDQSIDAVILGMHAKQDNPELIKAQKLGIKIYSYPEFIFEQSKNKKRIVIGGSHGKTTITSMIMHVLNGQNLNYDYLVGAQLEGYETMVKVTNDAPIIIMEGDEYLASPIDKRPKFHFYKPDIAVLSGIAWDHINVFPTFENYIEQFQIFIESISENGTIFYNAEDENLVHIIQQAKNPCKKIPYREHDSSIDRNITHLKTQNGSVPIQIFGSHNLQNLQAARLICEEIGIDQASFYQAIQSFKGASKRMELLNSNDNISVYKDFAHAPSKVKASIAAAKDQFSNRSLIACLELHTYSSLNKKFLDEYANTMNIADNAIVYFDNHALSLKQLPDLNIDDIKKAFANENLEIINNANELEQTLLNHKKPDSTFLLMSSGNFGGVNLEKLSKELTV